MQVFGIILSLALLCVVAYRGYSVLFCAPILALFAASFAGMNLLATYTHIFMPSLGGYITTYFPFFICGAIFGKAMEHTGAAESIARGIVGKMGQKSAVVAVVVTAAVLTYGGVSLFVVAFAIYPVGAALYKEADIPKRLLPGAIACGAFTFTMTAIPGSPQVQNAIPMAFFNTDLYAAPVFGCISAVMIFGCGVVWLEYSRRKAQKTGEGYGTHLLNEPEAVGDIKLPKFGLAVTPLGFVLLSTLVLQKIIFPRWDVASVVTDAPYNIAKTGVVGTMNNWALIMALIIGILITLLLNPRTCKNGGLKLIVNTGAAGCLLGVLNTATEVGYGNVIKALPGFQTIADALLRIGSGGSPLLSEAVTVNILSAITGSSSGGMTIALNSFSTQYINWANESGISLELLHRVAAIASGGIDTLPHNGAVITLLAITGLTHRQAYKDICMCTLVIPFSTCFIVILLQSIFNFV